MAATRHEPLSERAQGVAEACIAHRLRLLNRVISRIYDEELGEVNVTVAQFNVLTVIAYRQPVAASLIAKMLQLEKSGLSRNLRLLARNRWISHRPDGRPLALSLTEEGERAYHAALPKWQRAQEKTRRLIGEESISRLMEMADATSRRRRHE